MAIYITLAKFTDAGIKSIKDSPKRAQAFREMAQKKGVKVLNIYLVPWSVRHRGGHGS
jgi:uncharacterized protein with GYD domain